MCQSQIHNPLYQVYKQIASITIITMADHQSAMCQSQIHYPLYQVYKQIASITIISMADHHSLLLQSVCSFVCMLICTEFRAIIEGSRTRVV